MSTANLNPSESTEAELRAVRDRFINQWGVMGAAWGVNRTMAQIHALLMVAPEPLSTDAVMEALLISRGNANTNLRELVGWGLLRVVLRKGDRKEYFEAEKDPWKIFCIVARERQRREIEPAVVMLRECAERTATLKGTDAEAFHGMIQSLAEFVGLAAATMEKVARRERSKIVPLILKALR
jgi:DNA-binding transcriptional regulator GbsR (MarR family)